MSFGFTLDTSSGAARAARFATPHGVVDTPAFMAVGTLATVKALDPDDLRAMHAGMILANAYHLHLRPGDELVRELGGLHEFMHWDGPILTYRWRAGMIDRYFWVYLDQAGVVRRAHEGMDWRNMRQTNN